MPRQTKERPSAQGATRIDAIYRALFDAILAQELMPGTKLSEEQIGSFFGVSRTVVRAALNRLQNESLVEFKQNRGAFVASPSVEEARQVFKARVCVEREVASVLAETITDEQLARLESHVALEREAHRAGDDAPSIRLSGEFHLLAARMAGNDVLTHFLEELISRTSLVLALHGRHNSSECGLDEHREIVEALRHRLPARAGQAMKHHLEEILDRTRLGNGNSRTRKLTDILARYA